jgi:hypothetical protein
MNVKRLSIVGVVLNLACAVHDLCKPAGWWSYLFGAFSLGCAGVCAWAWALTARRKESP